MLYPKTCEITLRQAYRYEPVLVRKSLWRKVLIPWNLDVNGADKIIINVDQAFLRKIEIKVSTYGNKEILVLVK